MKYPPCSLHACVQHDPQHMTERAKFMLSPTVVMLTSQACTPSSPIRLVLRRSMRNYAKGRHIVFSDESHFQLCPDDNHRRLLRGLGQWGESFLTIASTQAHNKALWSGCHLLWELDSSGSHFCHSDSIALQWQHSTTGYVTVPFGHPGLTFQHANACLHAASVPIKRFQACPVIPWTAWLFDLSSIERLVPSRNIGNLVQ